MSLEKEIFGFSDDEDLDDIKELEQEEEFEERQLPSFKKRSRDEINPQETRIIQKKKRVSNIENIQRQERELSPESAKRAEARNDIDIALSRIKPKGRRKDLHDETEMDERMNTLLEDMKNAYYSDQQNIEAKIPAYAKMKLLPEVQVQLGRKHLQSQFLENNILEGVKLWLEPLADKSLPNIKIQKALLSNLEEMPIETHHLRQSHVGRVVMFYTKCTRVMPDIKDIANKLIDKWMRPILKRSSNYKDTEKVRVDMTLGDDRRSRKAGPTAVVREGELGGTYAPVLTMMDSRMGVGNSKIINDKYKKMSARMKSRRD